MTNYSSACNIMTMLMSCCPVDAEEILDHCNCIGACMRRMLSGRNVLVEQCMRACWRCPAIQQDSFESYDTYTLMRKDVLFFWKNVRAHVEAVRPADKILMKIRPRIRKHVQRCNIFLDECMHMLKLSGRPTRFFWMLRYVYVNMCKDVIFFWSTCWSCPAGWQDSIGGYNSYTYTCATMSYSSRAMHAIVEAVRPADKIQPDD